VLGFIYVTENLPFLILASKMRTRGATRLQNGNSNVNWFACSEILMALWMIWQQYSINFWQANL